MPVTGKSIKPIGRDKGRTESDWLIVPTYLEANADAHAGQQHSKRFQCNHVRWLAHQCGVNHNADCRVRESLRDVDASLTTDEMVLNQQR